MICLLGVFLVGCSEVVEDKGLQDKLVQQETQVKNYHLTLKQNEVKKKRRNKFDSSHCECICLE